MAVSSKKSREKWPFFVRILQLCSWKILIVGVVFGGWPTNIDKTTFFDHDTCGGRSCGPKLRKLFWKVDFDLTKLLEDRGQVGTNRFFIVETRKTSYHTNDSFGRILAFQLNFPGAFFKHSFVLKSTSGIWKDPCHVIHIHEHWKTNFQCMEYSTPQKIDPKTSQI